MADTNLGADSKTAQSNKIVRNYTVIALAPGMVLIPWVDLALLSAIQLKMLHRLAGLYDTRFSSQLGKSLIASLIGSTVSTSLASHFIPVVGPLFGGASMALLGGASTYAVGRVFIQHFESGGTLLTFDPAKVRDYYTHQLDTGHKRIAESFAGVKP